MQCTARTALKGAVQFPLKTYNTTHDTQYSYLSLLYFAPFGGTQTQNWVGKGWQMRSHKTSVTWPALLLILCDICMSAKCLDFPMIFWHAKVWLLPDTHVLITLGDCSLTLLQASGAMDKITLAGRQGLTFLIASVPSILPHSIYLNSLTCTHSTKYGFSNRACKPTRQAWTEMQTESWMTYSAECRVQATPQQQGGYFCPSLARQRM